MIHIAIGFALLIGLLFSPGTYILSLMINMDVAKTGFEPYQLHLLSIATNFWVPAVIFHQVAIRTRLSTILRPNNKLRLTIIISNSVIIVYLLARMFASTIEGGGGSYVVRSFSIFTLVPASLALCVSFFILIKQAVSKKTSNHLAKTRTTSLFLLTLIIPLSYVSYLLFAKGSPFKEADLIEDKFKEYCKSSGENIYESIVTPVESVYVSAGERRFRFDEKGKVRSTGIGTLGRYLLNKNIISFIEMDNTRKKSPGDGAYIVEGAKKRSPTTTNELKSKYGIFSTQLVSEEDRKLGITGEEVRVVDISNKKVLADTTYFYSKPHRLFCGHYENDIFSTYEFVLRVFELDGKI
ncbi:hypothetical protein [Kangiella sp. M94]